MKSEPNKQQSDWLDRAEELNDTEAAELNGGSSISEVAASLAEKLGGATGTSKASTSDNSPSSTLAAALEAIKSGLS